MDKLRSCTSLRRALEALEMPDEINTCPVDNGDDLDRIGRDRESQGGEWDVREQEGEDGRREGCGLFS